MIKGIDVAYYDRGMDWSKYDWDFCYVKVSEGLVMDSEFRAHWNAARGRTYRGGYHFFRPFVDPEQSARKCIEYMAGDLGELPLWFDLEVTAADAAGRANIAARAKSWLSWYEQVTGIHPIIYTAQNILYDLSSADISWMRNYKVCLAQYRYDNLSTETRTRILHGILTGAVTYSMPAVPSPFTRLAMVQWTGKGNPADVPGYYTGEGGKLAVDFDFYNGDLESFKQEFGLQPLTTEIPPTTEEPMSRYEATAIVNGTRLRPAHNTNNTYLGNYPIGTKFHGDELWTAPTDIYVMIGTVNTLLNKMGDQWLRVTDVNGTPTGREAWVAVTHKGAVITVLNDSGPVEPAAVYPVSAVVTVTNSDGSVSTLSGNFTRQS